MTAKGHVLFASTIALIPAYLQQNNIINANINFLLAYPFIIVGSLFPDVDEDNSYIGNKIKIFSVVFSSFVKHRTFTHYLIFPLLLFAIGYFNQGVTNKTIIIAFAAGILLHDIGDMLTKGGIKGFFFPFFPNTRIALLPYFLRFKTFSLEEHIFIYLILIPANLFLFYVIGKGGVVI